ncbi:AraC family transcriptional regulator [Streptomyces sp. NPDC049881]|uniref:helix-turn-helix transcriptional regulator n=1 Tax=unclassified Streptomyces TaxID=2593676 RepID=UPI003437EAD7
MWTRVAPAPGTPALDLLTASFDQLRYAPHAHAEFAVGVTTGGLETIRYRGADHVSAPGTLVVLEPGETHTGGPATPTDGFAYRAFYPPPVLLGEGVTGRPYFRSPVIEDPALATALDRAHRAATNPTPDPLRTETDLLHLLTALALRHAAPGTARPLCPLPGPDRIADAMRERLADQLAAPPSLAALATELGLSRYQALRAFRTSTGMTPYAWLAQHRVNRARALLERGCRPADAAARVGFADQAHLTRWFRRVLGVTPAAYRNSVQDAARRPR